MPCSSPRSSLVEMGWGTFFASHIKIKQSTGETASKRLKSNRLSFPPGKGTQPTSCSLQITLNKQNIALRVTESAKYEQNSSAAPAASFIPAHAWLLDPLAVTLVAAFSCCWGGQINCWLSLGLFLHLMGVSSF